MNNDDPDYEICVGRVSVADTALLEALNGPWGDKTVRDIVAPDLEAANEVRKAILALPREERGQLQQQHWQLLKDTQSLLKLMNNEGAKNVRLFLKDHWGKEWVNLLALIRSLKKRARG